MIRPIPSTAPAVRAGSAPAEDPGEPQSLPVARSRFIQDVLPWVTSVVVHVALIVLGVATASVILAPPTVQTEEQVLPVAGTLSERSLNTADIARLQGPSSLADLGQEFDPSAANGLARQPGPSIDVDAGGGAGSNAKQADLIAIGGGQFSFGSGTGPGRGNKSGSGTGDGGPLARFNPPGPGSGNNLLFVQQGPRARRIVYVCDATGTMINKLGALKHELRRSIADLSPVQSFNVVFFTDGGKYHIADRGGLVLATPDNKRLVQAFLDEVVPAGTTDPAPAIAAAFAQQPDLVFFLSDGEFNNLKPYDAVVEQFERSNTGRKARVNTILFETYDQAAEQAMQQIAARHGGVYRYVREADLH